VNAPRLSSLFVIGLSLGFVACGGESLTLPSEGEPATITVTKGGNQNGLVGTQLAESLEVQVTDTKGRPVGGATVNFAVTTGGGSAAPASAVTDGNGLANAQITLGTQTGTVTGTAQVQVPAGTVPVQTSFSATALPANANILTLVSGDNQQGPVGTALLQPLVVQVTDGFGNPIAGVNIDWTVDGGGSVSAASTPTDAGGLASVVRTLGPTAGQQLTLATSTGLAGSPITFTHTANAGSADRIVKVSGDGQGGLTGTELGQPLVVQVFDAQNNPIVGRAVAWLPGVGDGSVNPTTSNTDGQGLASTNWTLGAAGPNTVNAVVSGVGTATFNATATAGGPSATKSKATAAPLSIPVGGSSSITVTVKDASGNRLSGVTVTATSDGTGDSFSPTSAVTDDDGVATFSFSSTASGRKTITVVAGGVTLHDTPVITVILRPSTTTITGISPEPSTAGQSIHVTWSVTGNGGTPTGTVTVSSSLEATGDQCTNVPVSQGACDITLNTAGNHQISASYSGDAQFEDSGDQKMHTVVPVAPTDQPPVGIPDGYTTAGVNQPLAVGASEGVLANDTDPDAGAVLTAGNASTPAAGGSVILNSDGSFTYTPPLDATGTDSFTYTVSDGTLTSAATTVTITIP
jgi:hypothetical protein